MPPLRSRHSDGFETPPRELAHAPNIRLSLPSRAENVVLVRQVLTGLGEGVGLSAADLSDIGTAVTEACNNVVLHAYGEGVGPLELEASVSAGRVAVTVRDRGDDPGAGGPSTAGEHRGVGVTVIRALTERVKFRRTEGGMEVQMEFAATGTRPPAQPVGRAATARQTSPPYDDTARDGGTAVAIAIAPAALARTVLPRVLSAMAGRAHFTTDRLNDVQLVADALSARAGELPGAGRLEVGVRVKPHELELQIGPLYTARPAELIASSSSSTAPLIAALIDGQASLRTAIA